MLVEPGSSRERWRRYSGDVRRVGGTTWVAWAALWGLAVLAIGVPAGVVVWSVGGGLATGEGREAAAASAGLNWSAWWRLGTTVGVAALLGVLSMGLAAGPAWLVARGRWVWAGVCAGPMLLPAFLAYSGWSVLRGPRTAVARWLEGPASDLVADAPVIAGQAIAIAGLALWAWPLAMLGAAPAWSRIDQDVLDEARLSAGAWRGLGMRLRLMRGGLVMGAGVVALVMLGSAVPLHLSQIETDAIRLWLLLDLASADRRWTAWVGAWPTVLMAIVGSVVVWRVIAGGREAGIGRAGTGGGGGRLRWVGGVWMGVLLVVSVLGPMGLFAWSVTEGGLWMRFWRDYGEGLRESGVVAGWVGLVGAGMTALAAFVVTGRRAGALSRGLTATRPDSRRFGDGTGGEGALGLLVVVWMVAALVPGVMVGSATLDAWTRMGAGWVTQSSLIVVLTHVCRFGAVAALAGVWVARSEAREIGWLRGLDGALELVGWVRTAGASMWMTAIGTGVAMGLLSLYEIESAVIVQPPGVENLARRLLALLHFSRDEQLSVASVWLVGMGLVPAVLAGVAVAWAGRRRKVGLDRV